MTWVVLVGGLLVGTLVFIGLALTRTRWEGSRLARLGINSALVVWLLLIAAAFVVIISFFWALSRGGVP